MMGAQTFLADIVRDRANSIFGLRRLNNRRNGPSGGIASERTGEDRPGMASPSATILRRMPSGELGRDSILAAAEHETGGVPLEGLQDLRCASQEGVRNSLQGSNADSVRNEPEARISDSPQLPRSTPTGRGGRIKFEA